MFKLRLKRKGKSIPVSEKRLDEVIKGELNAYIKRDELQGYLEEIEKDKRKKLLWESLPSYKKVKVLKYVLEKKGEQHGKR